MDRHLSLRIPPDPRLGRTVRGQIVAFAAPLAIPPADLADFLSAVGEALANAIEHSGVHEEIDVTVWLAPDGHLVATVADRGVGFEPPAATSDTRRPEMLAERGRGIGIMQTCSHRFSISSAPGRGTVVTIGRRVTAITPNPEPVLRQ
jgi:anti-sigma regulatory factor (Ser/Thr protein kinase)